MRNMTAERRAGAGYDTAPVPADGMAAIGVSAVAWPAIFAGAFAAVATTFILVALGAGLGLSILSPWPGVGLPAASIGFAAIIWLILTQWLSSAFGGYLAGRLRTKWVGAHSDEVFFRDTAHGLLVWAVATVAGAAFLASAVTASAVGGARAAGAGAAQIESSADTPSDYLLDTLFRTGPQANPSGVAPETRAEAARIVATSLRNGTVSAVDRQYLAEMVAAKTGIDQQAAEKRLDDIVAQARGALEAGRKAGASLAIVTALALAIGAFVAAAAGALGGGHRDEPA
jgi:hypothetical protein